MSLFYSRLWSKNIAIDTTTRAFIRFQALNVAMIEEHELFSIMTGADRNNWKNIICNSKKLMKD